MHKLVSLSMMGLFFSSSTIAHAATCTVNGNIVPCEEFGKIGALVFAFGFGFFFLIFALGIAAFIFWVMMLIHAASNEIPEKIVWIIILVFTGFLGAIIYYFVVKRKFNKESKDPIPSELK